MDSSGNMATLGDLPASHEVATRDLLMFGSIAMISSENGAPNLHSIKNLYETDRESNSNPEDRNQESQVQKQSSMMQILEESYHNNPESNY